MSGEAITWGQTVQALGRALQVEPIKPVLKAPGSMDLKLRYDGPFQTLLSISTCAATAGHVRRRGRLQLGGQSGFAQLQYLGGGLPAQTRVESKWFCMALERN